MRAPDPEELFEFRSVPFFGGVVIKFSCKDLIWRFCVGVKVVKTSLVWFEGKLSSSSNLKKEKEKKKADISTEKDFLIITETVTYLL